MAIAGPLQNAAMANDRFDDRDCSASARDSQLDRSNQSRIDHSKDLAARLLFYVAGAQVLDRPTAQGNTL
jgi:hypothetical protein